MKSLRMEQNWLPVDCDSVAVAAVVPGVCDSFPFVLRASCESARFA